jgi:prepilin-type N-terminal cleavage/methylation domain-containing protein
MVIAMKHNHKPRRTKTSIVGTNEDQVLRRRRASRTRGFTLVEIIMVVLVGSILTAAAIPQVKRGLYNYRLRGAVASATWAIQSTRYQALQAGYPYQVVFTASTGQYQIQNLPTGTTYLNVGSAVPLSGTATTMTPDTTLQFKPNGAVVASVGGLSFTISYQGTTETITVSNYGNVSVTP